MIELNDFSTTWSLAVTSTSSDFVAPLPGGRFVIWSDRAVHLGREGGADTDDFYLVQGEYARVLMLTDEILSFVCAAAEPDGTIRITRAS